MGGMRMFGCFDVVNPVSARVAVVILLVGLVATSANAQMVHPGGWHTQADLTLIRNKVAAGEEPWITGWNAATPTVADFTSQNPGCLLDENAVVRISEGCQPAITSVSYTHLTLPTTPYV